nr:MAG TPA: hypothetical protein [Caudoviricetes sp.]
MVSLNNFNNFKNSHTPTSTRKCKFGSFVLLNQLNINVIQTSNSR